MLLPATTRIYAATAIALLVLLVVSGCGNQGDDRRFAGEEVDTVVPTDVSTPPEPTRVANAASPVVGTPLPIAALMLGHSDLTTVVLLAGNALYAVDSGSGERSLLFDAGESTIIATTSTDDGQLTGILTTASTNDRVTTQLSVVSVEGAVLVQIDNLGGMEIPATPAAVKPGVGGLAWRESDRTLTVALPRGGLLSIDPAGNIRTLLPPNRAVSPGSLAWSTDSSAIALVAGSTSASGSGVAIAPAGVPLDPVWLLEPSRSRQSILQVDWLDGNGATLYLLENAAGGISGGDLLQQQVVGTQPDLFAAAGAFSPVSAITHFAVPVDQQIVAFAVQSPGVNADQPATVVIQQVEFAHQKIITLQRSVAITDLAWTRFGLLVAGLPSSSNANDVVFYLIDASGTARIVANPADATPTTASPVASPRAVVAD